MKYTSAHLHQFYNLKKKGLTLAEIARDMGLKIRQVYYLNSHVTLKLHQSQEFINNLEGDK
jgi:hypothetical protein